ncbi:flagellar hook-length control protein FliK [Sneathiella sp. HT1-7]|uniref:flagellar hook-length control protein FliK n=1 Tax=Sneathiella sp. HT1-7 TaxID=2887192 RepID=UPI001D1462E3|nr:flagellar hook-length control protein FliK [Sneathiella sp. HT1-7]MCC3306567.1 flagellar hook-length control protein FliK [Sneathiella sp. HT1-7]
MDVGQIISATTEPKNRDKDPYRNEDEDFASYVNEAAPKDESPIKEKSAGQNSGDAEEPAMTQNTAPESSVKDDSAPNEDVPASNSTPAAVDKAPASEKAAGTQVVDSTAASTTALPATPVSAPAPTGTDVTAEKSPTSVSAPAITAANAQAPTVGASPETPTAENDVVADAGKKPEINANPTNIKNSDATSAQAAASVSGTAQTDAKKPAEKNVATTSAQPGNEKALATPASSEVLATMRAEANAKMSEKDVLSSKIAEMLQDGNGKISLTASKQQQSFQTALASSTNLVTANLANNATANPALLAGASGEMDGAGSQAPLPVTGNAQVLPSDSMNQTLPAAPTGSVQSIEATAANTASQASNAARAAAQLPVTEQVSTQISAAIKEGHDRIKISLHPSELGRVEVKLDIGHDGRVLAAVSVDKQETLDLLQRDARSLERALQDAGFDTGSNSLNFSLNQNGQGDQGEDMNFANMNLPMGEAGSDTDLSNIPLQTTAGASMNDGGLDIQV